MTRLDWIAVGFVALTAFIGLRKGLVASALSVVGIVAGAVIGARLAPQLLTHGSRSPYTPLVALGGAIVLAAVLEALASIAGSIVRQGMRLPPLRALDSAGGLVLGGVAGLAIVWVLGAVALLIPGQDSLRRDAQRSLILRRLNGLVSPSTLLHALARVDPFPSVNGPAAPTLPPTPAVLAQPAIRRAAPSVVRVLGEACGLGIGGTGWVAEPGLVVTAAHVVAGERDTIVLQPGSSERLPAQPVAFDPHDDVAVLRVRSLRARALPMADPTPGQAVALLGYAGNGPLDSKPGRIGRTQTVFTEDAYGHGPVARTITSIGGLIRHGDSGGPAIDGRGAVESTIFAARIGAPSGYGVPPSVVRRELAKARAPVSTGPCAP